MPSLAAADLVSRVLREGLLLVLVVSAPPLLASLVVGVVGGIVQSATQIPDATLTFVPKLVAVILVLLVAGPPIGAQVVRFAQALLATIPMIR